MLNNSGEETSFQMKKKNEETREMRTKKENM